MIQRSSDPLLCHACKTKQHTSPPAGSAVCQCGTRTCACYGAQVAAGARKERGIKVAA